MPDAGRFPRPWTVARNADAFWVEAANGARFGYTYIAAKGAAHSDSRHSEDDARRLVTNFAKLGKG